MQVDSHFIFDIIFSAVTVGWIVVGLLISRLVAEFCKSQGFGKASLGDIRLSQQQDKEDLIANQTAVKDELTEKHGELIRAQYSMKEEMNAKHAENKQQIAVHTADDAGEFQSIKGTLERIEKKQDRYFNGKTS